jgi:hypothetical protein
MTEKNPFLLEALAVIISIIIDIILIHYINLGYYNFIHARFFAVAIAVVVVINYYLCRFLLFILCSKITNHPENYLFLKNTKTSIQTRIMFYILIILFFITQFPNFYISKNRDDLIVIQGAKDIRYAKIKGSSQVAYRVSMAYPGTKALSELHERVKSRGWARLQKNYFNSGQSLANWITYIKGTKQMQLWWEQWADKNGDILWLTLHYESPNTQDHRLENQNNLHICVCFVPASLAEKGRKAALLKTQPLSDKK